jgi:hypothetical protein
MRDTTAIMAVTSISNFIQTRAEEARSRFLAGSDQAREFSARGRSKMKVNRIQSTGVEAIENVREYVRMLVEGAKSGLIIDKTL